MAKGKKYADAAKRFDRDQLFTPAEALELVKSLASAKFDETVELVVRLGVDPRKADQVRAGHRRRCRAGTGKDVRVAVFAAGDAAAEARRPAPTSSAPTTWPPSRPGRHARLRRGHRHARPDAPRRPAGPGARPPRPHAQPEDRHRHDRRRPRRSPSSRAARSSTAPTAYGNVHVPIGKASFTADALLANFRAVLDELQRVKPASAKGKYLKKIAAVVDDGPGREGRHEPAPPGPDGRRVLSSAAWTARPRPASVTDRYYNRSLLAADLWSTSGWAMAPGRQTRRTSFRSPRAFVPCARAPSDACRKEVSMENPRPEKVAVVDRGARALRAGRRRAAHRVPRAERQGPGRPAPPAAAGRRRVQGLQEHPRALRRPRRSAASELDGPAHRPDRHHVRARRCRGGGQDAARLRPDQPEPGGEGRPARRQGAERGGRRGPGRPAVPRRHAGPLAGAFQAPLVKLAGLLQALPRNFAYGLQALIDQRGGAPAAPTTDDANGVAANESADAPGVADDNVGTTGPADEPSGAASAADEPADEPTGEPETNDAAAAAEE